MTMTEDEANEYGNVNYETAKEDVNYSGKWYFYECLYEITNNAVFKMPMTGDDGKWKYGFIGLGIMGKPMCRKLMKAGYEAVVYNRSKASVEELAAEGAQAAGSPAEVAENCQVIITMLPNLSLIHI